MLLNLSAIRHTFKVYERLKREQHIHTLFLTGKAFSVFPIRFIYHLVNEGEVRGTESDAPQAEESVIENTASRSPFPAPNVAAPRSPHSALKCGFSVPKKKFRKSVHRHQVRRLMVEAWRLNKQDLIDALPPGKQLHVFLVFNGKELPEYAHVLPAVKTGIEKLISITTKQNPPTQ